MNDEGRKRHWENVYCGKRDREFSWYQNLPSVSLELVELAGIRSDAAVIDIGGGTSLFSECLIEKGIGDISVLDLSQSALEESKRRLGSRGAGVCWLVADITTWRPKRQYDLWHDRAVFHFLVEKGDRAAYLDRLEQALKRDGFVIIATFAPDGPKKCSGLPVVRYSPDSLWEALGANYELVAHRLETHETPWGSKQSFQFSLFRKTGGHRRLERQE